MILSGSPNLRAINFSAGFNSNFFAYKEKEDVAIVVAEVGEKIGTTVTDCYYLSLTRW